MTDRKIIFVIPLCILILSVFSGLGCIDKKVTNNSNNGLAGNASEECENHSNNSIK